MERKYVGMALGALIVTGAALGLPSCGHDQKLVSIAVTLQTAIYSSPNSGAVDFAAAGTYIHPPETRDITAQVTWSTDVTELLSFNYVAGTGETVAPNNGNCGIANIWASAPEGTGGASNIVISSPSTVTVQNTANPLCPGGSNTAGELVLTPAGTGAGTVTSSPAGISCPGTACGFAFSPPSNVVILTATAGTGSTFAGFSTSCATSTTNSNQCTVTVPSGGVVNVTATFNPNGP